MRKRIREMVWVGCNADEVTAGRIYVVRRSRLPRNPATYVFMNDLGSEATGQMFMSQRTYRQLQRQLKFMIPKPSKK